MLFSELFSSCYCWLSNIYISGRLLWNFILFSTIQCNLGDTNLCSFYSSYILPNCRSNYQSISLSNHRAFHSSVVSSYIESIFVANFGTIKTAFLLPFLHPYHYSYIAHCVAYYSSHRDTFIDTLESSF